jgi:hypothetical protein
MPRPGIALSSWPFRFRGQDACTVGVQLGSHGWPSCQGLIDDLHSRAATKKSRWAIDYKSTCECECVTHGYGRQNMDSPTSGLLRMLALLAKVPAETTGTLPSVASGYCTCREIADTYKFGEATGLSVCIPKQTRQQHTYDTQV